MEKKLYRDPENGIFFGVCAGVAEYFNMDVSIVRLLFLLLAWNIGLIPYIIAGFVIPEKPQDGRDYYNDEM